MVWLVRAIASGSHVMRHAANHYPSHAQRGDDLPRTRRWPRDWKESRGLFGLTRHHDTVPSCCTSREMEVAVVCTRVIIESRYGISPAGRQPVCSRSGQGAAILVTSIYIAGSYHRDIRRLRTHGYKSTILRRPCWRSRRPFSGAVELSCDTCNKMYTIIFFFYDSHTG